MMGRSEGADARLDAIDRAMIGLLVENAPRRPVKTRNPMVTVLHVGACMPSEIPLRWSAGPFRALKLDDRSTLRRIVK